MFTLICDIFIICFVLFLFVTCFEWNFNAIATATAAEAAVAAAEAAVAATEPVVVVVDIRSFLLYFPYLFTIQLTFLP
jgi:hypothetical protein